LAGKRSLESIETPSAERAQATGSGRLDQLISRSQRFRRRLRTLLARLGSPIQDANAGEAARTDSPQPGDEPPAPP
jgi:hypothetical protein